MSEASKGLPPPPTNPMTGPMWLLRRISPIICVIISLKRAHTEMQEEEEEEEAWHKYTEPFRLIFFVMFGGNGLELWVNIVGLALGFNPPPVLYLRLSLLLYYYYLLFILFIYLFILFFILGSVLFYFYFYFFIIFLCWFFFNFNFGVIFFILCSVLCIIIIIMTFVYNFCTLLCLSPCLLLFYLCTPLGLNPKPLFGDPSVPDRCYI
jgi:hypothetical protein